MIIRDPEHMTDKEVAEMWDKYREMDDKLPERLCLGEREMNPMDRDEMIDAGMVFLGDIPVIVPACDKSSINQN